jgi:hypothetical protein
MSSTTRRVLLTVLLACGSLALSVRAQAPAPAVSEQALKAVLFYKLPLFTYRERDVRGGVLTLCTLGRTQLDEALRNLAESDEREQPDPQANGLARRFQVLAGVEEIAECAFGFGGRAEAARLGPLLAELARPGLVTVSDIRGFARAGGMVELALRGRGEGLAIVINRRAARDAGVEFMAQLLRLAEVIDE